MALNAVRFGFCVPRYHFKRAYKSSHYFLLNPLRNRKTSIKMGELVLDSDNEDVPLSILLKDRRTVMIKDEYEEDEDSFASIKKENYSVKTEVKIEEEKKDTRASKKRSRTTKVKNEGEKPTKKRKTSKRKNAKGVKKEKEVTVKKERKPKRKPKTEAEKRKERELKLKKEEEEAHIYKWWENQDDLDGEIKWHTLEHHGVIFPDEYKPLPKSVKLLYDGEPVSLPPEAEEVAGFYGAMLETEHAKNPVFQKNFFKDFKAVLKESGGCPEAKITKFEKCDFSHIYKYFDKQREKKRAEKHREKSKQLKAEARNHKYDLSASVTVEKLEKQVDKLEERIRNAHLQLKDREDNSSVALSTSKVNYIDPRLTVMFSKKYDVPIEKLFTKSLRQKFAWAIESADKDWRF